MMLEIPDELKNEPDFNNILSNKKRSKKRDFNEFNLITKLIKKYKDKNDEKVMLEIIKALEGIINTYTIIICPGDPTQQIYLNPYMKKYIGMFLTKDEQISTTYQTYMQAVYRIRWIMRYWTYEDLYSYLVSLIIDIVNKIKIIGTCDCFYYIQLVIRFKMHTLVINTAKDITVDIKEMPTDFSSIFQNDEYEDTIERLSLTTDDLFYEDKIISNMYDEVDISVLNNNEDVFKCFCAYEKYIIYLFDYLGLTTQKILSILKYESDEDLNERIEDIRYKLELSNRGEI